MTITPEQRHEIDQVGAVYIEDAETHASYVIMKTEVYERIKSLLENGRKEIADGIRRSQDERIGIAPSDEPLIREINRRGIQDDEFDLFVIRPQDREPVEVTYPSSW
jgi:hypothetical protein